MFTKNKKYMGSSLQRCLTGLFTLSLFILPNISTAGTEVLTTDGTSVYYSTSEGDYDGERGSLFICILTKDTSDTDDCLLDENQGDLVGYFESGTGTHSSNLSAINALLCSNNMNMPPNCSHVENYIMYTCPTNVTIPLGTSTTSGRQLTLRANTYCGPLTSRSSFTLSTFIPPPKPIAVVSLDETVTLYYLNKLAFEKGPKFPMLLNLVFHLMMEDIFVNLLV